jgi:hypothetical protein
MLLKLIPSSNPERAGSGWESAGGPNPRKKIPHFFSDGT